MLSLRPVVQRAVILVGGVVLWGALHPARAADPTPVYTTLVLQSLISPRPVPGADGRIHLAYELSFVNETRLLSQIDSIAAVDAESGAVLAEWKGKELTDIFRINGDESGTALAPSHSAYAFLDIALPASAAAPKAIKHRISVTRMTPEPGNEHQGTALDPKANVPANVMFEGAPTTVDTKKPIAVAAPLRGAGWVAINGCCAQISAHRGAVLAFDGKA